MAAPQRVSSQEIVAALERGRGNKSAAARDLGISENALRKRLPANPAIPAPASLRAVRIPAEDFERLRQAGFDLAYVERRVWSADEVARVFVREALPSWLESKLAELRGPKGGR